MRLKQPREAATVERTWTSNARGDETSVTMARDVKAFATESLSSACRDVQNTAAAMIITGVKTCTRSAVRFPVRVKVVVGFHRHLIRDGTSPNTWFKTIRDRNALDSAISSCLSSLMCLRKYSASPIILILFICSSIEDVAETRFCTPWFQATLAENIPEDTFSFSAEMTSHTDSEKWMSAPSKCGIASGTYQRWESRRGSKGCRFPGTGERCLHQVQVQRPIYRG